MGSQTITYVSLVRRTGPSSYWSGACGSCVRLPTVAGASVRTTPLRRGMTPPGPRDDGDGDGDTVPVALVVAPADLPDGDPSADAVTAPAASTTTADATVSDRRAVPPSLADIRTC